MDWDHPIMRDLVVVAVTALSIVGVILVRRFVNPEKLARNNEFTGFTFTFVGLLYGVFLAFTCCT